MGKVLTSLPLFREFRGEGLNWGKGRGGVSPEKSSQVTSVVLHSANNPSQKEQPQIEQPKRIEYHLHLFSTTPVDTDILYAAAFY